MTPQTGLLLASLVIAALNAWLTKNIREAILQLKLDLVERIAKTEADVKVLQAQK